MNIAVLISVPSGKGGTGKTTVVEGRGACKIVCPQNAISLVEEKAADVFLTKTIYSSKTK